MFPLVTTPQTGVQHREDNCRININTRDQGIGTLYISEERLVWKNAEDRGLSLEYKMIAIHAISKDSQAFPEECLYVMYNDEIPESASVPATNGVTNGHSVDNDSSDEENPFQENRKITEMRFIPQNKDHLKSMFDAMSDCQCLHPDSEDSDDYYDGGDGDNDGENTSVQYNPTFQDGAGEGFYTTEEGFQNLTAQGRATLERLENMLSQSQISNDGAIDQMAGVVVEEEEGETLPDPNDPPTVGRSNDEPMDDSNTCDTVEGQFDDAD